MNDDRLIVEGDIVDVFWENIEPIFDAAVFGRPYSEGEAWMLDVKGVTVYIQHFSKMVLKMKGHK